MGEENALWSAPASSAEMEARKAALAKMESRESRIERGRILLGKPVASVKSEDVPIIDGKLVDSAVSWIREHPQTDVNTPVGLVSISEDDMDIDFWHTKYPNKLAVLPAIRAVLERGAYLGGAEDVTRDNAVDYYFAAPVEIDGEEKIVFVRTIAEENSPHRLHVHEVFMLEDMEKARPISPVQVVPYFHMQENSARLGKRKMSDLYRGLIRDALDAAQRENAGGKAGGNGRTGHAQPLDALVLTPKGWRKMGDLRVGDFVVGSDGQPTRVNGIFPQGKQHVYRVSLRGGASTRATAEHLWATRPGRGGRWKILTTAEIVERLRAGVRVRVPVLPQRVAR